MNGQCFAGALWSYASHIETTQSERCVTYKALDQPMHMLNNFTMVQSNIEGMGKRVGEGLGACLW